MEDSQNIKKLAIYKELDPALYEDLKDLLYKLIELKSRKLEIEEQKLDIVKSKVIFTFILSILFIALAAYALWLKFAWQAAIIAGGGAASVITAFLGKRIILDKD